MINPQEAILRAVAARLVVVIAVLRVHSKQLAQTTIQPPWPGRPFKLACSQGTTQENCAQLGSADGLKVDCFEPERDTQEVLNSFLIHCDGCLYVDVGCNIGYFAAHAAALGATVDCYEPLPNYVNAIKVTGELNGMSDQAFRVYQGAIIPDDESHGLNRTFKKGYGACSMHIGKGPWTVPKISIRHILAGRRVKLLKIDIDSVEGLLFHTIVNMIKNNETSIETILIEIGCLNCGHERFCATSPPHRRFLKEGKWRSKCTSASHPRGGDIKDFLLIQHNLRYDVYRVNAHTGREIYNWTGENVNQNMVPQRKGVLPMFSVRMMRKLEKVLPTTSLADYTELFRWGTSFLITREQLAEVNSHHVGPLKEANLTLLGINEGNPAFR